LFHLTTIATESPRRRQQKINLAKRHWEEQTSREIKF